MRYETPDEFFRIPEGDKMHCWIEQILQEYDEATQKFGAFNSAHEGYYTVR